MNSEARGGGELGFIKNFKSYLKFFSDIHISCLWQLSKDHFLFLNQMDSFILYRIFYMTLLKKFGQDLEMSIFKNVMFIFYTNHEHSYKRKLNACHYKSCFLNNCYSSDCTTYHSAH